MFPKFSYSRRYSTEVLHLVAGLLVALLAPPASWAQEDSLRLAIQRAVLPAQGAVGVAMKVLGGGDTLTVNGGGHFPMQSVYKFPLALAVLSRVDRGDLSLDQSLHLTKRDLLPNTWSPLRMKFPSGDTTVTLGEVLRYTVSQSDNNGCDILFRLIGGPAVVNEYVHDLGILDMAIVATEEEMHAASDVQFNNWSSPAAMAQLLEAFHTGGVLSEESREYLWSLMAGAVTGQGRLKSKLPEGTIVAHKSGSSGTNDKGIAAATNDVGLIGLPDGREVIVVVFVSNSSANEQTRDEVIANVARAVWDAYAGKE